MVPVFNALFITVLGLREYAQNFSIHWYYFLLTALCLMHTYLVAQKMRLRMSTTDLQSRKEQLEEVK